MAIPTASFFEVKFEFKFEFVHIFWIIHIDNRFNRMNCWEKKLKGVFNFINKSVKDKSWVKLGKGLNGLKGPEFIFI